MPLRHAHLLAATGCRCAVTLLAVALATAPVAAEPQWATDLRAKADGWKRELRDSIG